MTTADRVFDILLKNLPEDGESNNNFWSCPEAGEILCKNAYTMIRFRNLLYGLGADPDEIETGYYDPVQDEKSGCTDGRTGYYFIKYVED